MSIDKNRDFKIVEAILSTDRNDASIAYEAKYQAILDYFMGIDGVKGADEYSYDETALADEDWKALYEMVRDLRNEITKS